MNATCTAPRSRVPAGGALENKQKAAVCILAREAWEKAGCPGDYTEWRHAEQARACGHGSLLACTQEHYLLLRAHFKNLVGRAGSAFKDLVKHGTQDKQVALYKLRSACGEFGFNYPDYPGAICRRQYRCALGEASATQVWNLFITVRSRGQARRRQAAGGKA